METVNVQKGHVDQQIAAQALVNAQMALIVPMVFANHLHRVMTNSTAHHTDLFAKNRTVSIQNLVTTATALLAIHVLITTTHRSASLMALVNVPKIFNAQRVNTAISSVTLVHLAAATMLIA